MSPLLKPCDLTASRDAVRRAEVMSFAAGPLVPLQHEATLATLCTAEAKRSPNALALMAGEQQLTFAELHARAEDLARRLVSMGVRPGIIVGVALPRDPSLIVAVLAIHKA